jgi:AcrR family transcriptional regulator
MGGGVTQTATERSGERTGETRTASKRRLILEAARTVFFANGYRGTSMDEVAALAGVSKQTIYKQFVDKERLFREIVTTTVDEVADPVYDEVLAVRDSGDVEADLRDVARRQLASVMGQPMLLQLRRLVIGEAGRFPELGKTFYERGPGRTIEALATSFAKLADRGLLTIPDPLLAAQHFNWLVMSIPLNQAMLLGTDGLENRKELDRLADEGVRVFLAAYDAARSPR